jgi:hypothetical protein
MENEGYMSLMAVIEKTENETEMKYDYYDSSSLLERRHQWQKRIDGLGLYCAVFGLPRRATFSAVVPR